MRVLLRKCLRGHNNLFEWSATGKTWYKINYKRIVPLHNGDTDPFKALEPFRNAMTKMRFYAGFHIAVFEGNYDREKKVLKVTL
jgi:hypothetical protein